MIIGLDPQSQTVNVQTQALRPVGSVIKLYVSANPASLLGFGIWQRIAQGKILISLNEMDPDFSTLAGTGGEKTHALAADEAGNHNHTGTVGSLSHSHESSISATSGGTSHDHTASSRGLQNTVQIRYGSTSAQFFFPGTEDTAEGGVHTHKVTGETADASGTGPGQTASRGDGLAHNNMPPFFSVYIWKRVS